MAEVVLRGLSVELALGCGRYYILIGVLLHTGQS